MAPTDLDFTSPEDISAMEAGEPQVHDVPEARRGKGKRLLWLTTAGFALVGITLFAILFPVLRNDSDSSSSASSTLIQGSYIPATSNTTTINKNGVTGAQVQDGSLPSYANTSSSNSSCNLNFTICTAMMFFCSNGEEVSNVPQCINGTATCAPGACSDGSQASPTRSPQNAGTPAPVDSNSSCNNLDFVICTDMVFFCRNGDVVSNIPQCINGTVTCAPGACSDGSQASTSRYPVSLDCGADQLGCSSEYYCQDGSLILSNPQCVNGNPTCAVCLDGSDPQVSPYDNSDSGDISTKAPDDCGLSGVRCATIYYCQNGTQVNAEPQCIDGAPVCAVCPDGSDPFFEPYECSTENLDCSASAYYCPDGSEVPPSPVCVQGQAVCAVCSDQSVASFTPLNLQEPECDASMIFCPQVMFYCPDGSELPPTPQCVNGTATCTPTCSNGQPGSMTQPPMTSTPSPTWNTNCNMGIVPCADTYYCQDGSTVPATPHCDSDNVPICALCRDGSSPSRTPYNSS